MFAGAMMRDFEDDPFFRGHFDGMRQMQESMNGMMRGFGGGFFGDPFAAGRRAPAIGYHPLDPSGGAAGGGHMNQQVAMRPMDPFGGMFMDMNRMMGGMMGGMHRQMDSGRQDPNSHFYTQSTVMSFSNTGQGPPKVYQASTSTHQAPGGVRETRRAVRDSERGLEKMAIGHHIQDRAHVIERQRDARTGEEEENQELINLDDTERDTFDREFREKMGAYAPRRGHGGQHSIGRGGERSRHRALTQEPHSTRSYHHQREY